MVEPTPLLELRGIVKRFPGSLANDHIDLTLTAGRIQALLGENGAGKSTLVKIMYGVLRPDSGEISWRGTPIVIASPAHARRLGIGMVFQHFSLFEALTVAENIALGLDDAADRKDLLPRMAEISARYGLPLDARRVVHDLSVGERQRIEIVRCLLQKPRLLIMDEPTSVLTPQEVERLFSTLRQLAAEGCGILYISHKLEEIGALCEEATILRQGRVVAACDPRRETHHRLAELMVGAEIKPPARRQRPARAGTPRLEVDRLNLRSDRQFGTDLKDISFTVSAGEIFGIGGIAGNGQNELMETLSGEVAAERGDAIRYDGKAIGGLGVPARRALGACFVPEQRLGHGAVEAMTLSQNGFLSAYARRSLARLGLIDRRRTDRFAKDVIGRFDVRGGGADSEARTLSGGNLQKFIVGREVLQRPALLVVNQPTWGVDVGAAIAIQQAIVDLADGGAAVVLISQDLDELLGVCDRLAIIAGGRLSPARAAADMTMGEIGLLMGGVGSRSADAA
ncbi:MAG: ABC transporter ATP-binding protein [Alphaproteobacteria bacterium]|nr:ABC transporter ATP-binding protein [Alphaproteobacteria bacterium]